MDSTGTDASVSKISAGSENRHIPNRTKSRSRLRHTIVNGAPMFEGTECTSALPGKLLRSYDMVG